MNTELKKMNSEELELVTGGGPVSKSRSASVDDINESTTNAINIVKTLWTAIYNKLKYGD